MSKVTKDKFMLAMDIHLVEIEVTVTLMAAALIDGKTEEALESFRQFYVIRDKVQGKIDKGLTND